MMSAQPSQHFSDPDNDPSRWKAIIALAGQLSVQPDITSQLACLVKQFERVFHCQVSLWIGDSFSSLVAVDELRHTGVNVADQTELIEQAVQETQVVSGRQLEKEPDVGQSTIAVPLGVDGEVFGALQFERVDRTPFDDWEIELASSLAIQSSIILDWKRKSIALKDQQHSIELLYTLSSLSKSISSHLDLDNLVNNVISSLHQRFGFVQVRVCLVSEDEPGVMKVTAISDQGIMQTESRAIGLLDEPVSWVISHKEALIINNTAHEKRFPPAVVEQEVKSELVLPLVSGDSLLGVLELCSASVFSFPIQTVTVFKSLVENLSIAVRNIKLYRLEQLRGQVADQVQNVIKGITAENSLDDVLAILMDELEKCLQYEAAAIWLFDNTSSDTGLGQYTSALRLAAVRVKKLELNENEPVQGMTGIELHDLLVQMEDDENSIFTSYPWLLEILASDHPVHRRLDSLEPIGQLLSLPDGYSALGQAFYVDDQPIGLVVIAERASQGYGKEAEMIASAFFRYAAIAVNTARLFTAAHEQVWLSTALIQVVQALQSISSSAEMLETAASLLVDFADANGCVLYLWDPSTEAFFPQASYGFDSEQQARLTSWDVHSGSVPAFDQLFISRLPVILDSENFSDDLSSLIFPSYHLQDDLIILFPMTIQDSLLGAALVDFNSRGLSKDSSQRIWDEKYALIQGITQQVASTYDTLQLIKSSEEEAYISIALLQVAQAIVSLNQLDEILGSIVRITPILVGVKRCAIYLWDGSNQAFKPSQFYGFSKNELQFDQVFRASEYPFLEKILETNQIVYVSTGKNSSPSSWNEIEPGIIRIIEGSPSDSDEQPPIRLDDEQLADKTSLLIGFPLSVKNDVLGVMLVEEDDPVKEITSQHIREKRIEIVRGITQQAAVAIKNELLQQEAVKSERMERELQLAREIQATFLPDHLPELPGWEMDIRWQPAREVGGDFYDILPLSDGQVGFVIADVADKGMPAALFMTLIRTLIRAAAKDTTSPASVLKQVNDLLLPDAKHGMFVTVFYGVFDLSSGKLTYANAGHNPPIIRRSQLDELIELKRTMIALGLFDDIEVQEQQVTLDHGDWIVFYTDGVTEAFSVNEEMFGTRRLYDLIISDRYNSARELLDRIENAVQEFIRGAELSDDLTLAAMLRK